MALCHWGNYVQTDVTVIVFSEPAQFSVRALKAPHVITHHLSMYIYVQCAATRWQSDFRYRFHILPES